MKKHEISARELEVLFLLLFGKSWKKNHILVDSFMYEAKSFALQGLLSLKQMKIDISFSLQPNTSLPVHCQNLISEGWVYLTTVNRPHCLPTRKPYQVNDLALEAKQLLDICSDIENSPMSLLPFHPLTNSFFAGIDLVVEEFDIEMISQILDDLLISYSSTIFHGEEFSPKRDFYVGSRFVNELEPNKFMELRRSTRSRIEDLLEIYKLHREGVLDIVDFEPVIETTYPYGFSFFWAIKLDYKVRKDKTSFLFNSFIEVDRSEGYTFFGFLGYDREKKVICYKYRPPLTIKESTPFKLLQLLLSEKRVHSYLEIYTNLNLGPEADQLAMKKSAQDVKRELLGILLQLGFSKSELDSQLQQRDNGYIFDY